jgi:glycosyltransferase involved in cell wall biosynthesis
MLTPAPFDILFEKESSGILPPSVSVAISCFKYGREGCEALDSLLDQTEQSLDVILVDDQSPDDSVTLLTAWLGAHSGNPKFSKLLLARHLVNQGLSQSRNTALALVETPYVFILDADNNIYPRALQVLREALENSGAAMSYSLIERFGAASGIMNNSAWLPSRFSYGNYIDAMAMVRTDVIRNLNGYRVMPNKFGWEDYDLWCSFVDHELKGCHVPQILCRYRIHEASMLRQTTNNFFVKNGAAVRQDFEAHHTIPFFF